MLISHCQKLANIVIALEIQSVTLKTGTKGRPHGKLLLWANSRSRFCRGQRVKAVPLEKFHDL